MNTQPTLAMDMPEHATLQRIVRFAYEIGAARHKPRSWEQVLQQNVANVAEHSYRVTFLAMLLAQMEGADPFRAATISMVHDTDEIRGMDLTPYQKAYMALDSKKAVHDTFAGTPLETLCLSLFNEYKAKESLEAKCVKDADLLDAMLELTEISQNGNAYLMNPTVQSEMPTRRASLRTESGRKLFDMILSGHVNPWDWFHQGPSTFKDGTYGK